MVDSLDLSEISQHVASGFTNTAIVVAFGAISRSSSSRLDPSAPARKLTPVALLPNRLRLVTRPSLTWSLSVTKTIGTVVKAPSAHRPA
jgi:hypothetical protein